ncbi:patatin-like phospholipase family protein [Methylobacterium persicinum]
MTASDSLYPSGEASVLVLQGGGALGSYQAGIYDALCEQGCSIDWVAGISIGAINAALIAGNPLSGASRSFVNSGTLSVPISRHHRQSRGTSENGLQQPLGGLDYPCRRAWILQSPHPAGRVLSGWRPRGAQRLRHRGPQGDVGTPR